MQASFISVPDTNHMYNGEVILTEGPIKKFIMCGKGELLMFPYLYVGEFKNNVPHGSGAIYYKPISQYGKVVDFSLFSPSAEQKIDYMKNYSQHFSLIHQGTWTLGKCNSDVPPLSHGSTELSNEGRNPWTNST